ncbi:hypothetical protein E4198_23325 [Streptomyces sp. RKND-216]|uniref:hypothetical protein n=1 Tax=Streptomyces sp. RKND-216 TaxID=2562581 RepID=UPI00109E264F|nr:hypothetical protein [Streptomyces sp. RKND-216]THA27191.1 hypothetical protein E4198_23325 [Streptomyces sp. RKND-216]
MVVHLVVMGTVVFGLLHAARFHRTDPATWLAGQVIGLVHGLAVGVMAMPVVDAVPRERAGPAGVSGWTHWASWAAGTGKGTPVDLLVGHLLYGVVVALVCAALV